MQPTVTVAIPVFNEAPNIRACLDAVAAQTYAVTQVLVVDGGSTDATRLLAAGRPGVTVLDNPHRIQAAGLNVALAAATGEIFVRVDGHCTIAADYVERCVEALERSGAAIVGGAMRPVAVRGMQRAIAAAMSSALGAGPARFHVGGDPGWVDTVYLGAFRTAAALQAGGYAEDMAVNEDAEFAYRMAKTGRGVWFDPSIRSAYVPRSDLAGLTRQFYRYGRSRAVTVQRHPGSLKARQLAAPLLVVAVCTPWRKQVLAVYTAALAAALGRKMTTEPAVIPGMALAMPAMHFAWGAGFLRGLLFPR